MSVDINNYPTLDSYTVLATSALTGATTTINNGSYGCIGTSPIGTYNGNGTEDNNPVNLSQAQTELTYLTAAINAVSVSPVTIGGGSQTFLTGRYNSASSIGFTSGSIIKLDAGGDANAQFFFTAGSNIDFDTVSNIKLQNGAQACNVFWLAETAITFSGSTSPTNIPGIFIAGTAITFAAASNISGRLYAGTAITFAENATVTNPCPYVPPTPVPVPEPYQEVVCYLKGTLILTKDGFVPIEKIKTGQRVVTKGKIYKNKYVDKNANLKTEPIYWASKFKVTNLNSKSRPICIKKDALAKNFPFQDLYVSPNHAIIIDGNMVLAKYMINDNTIYQDKECTDVEYYHLETESHSTIYANGVLSESYFGGNNRHIFENSISLRRRVDFKKIYDLRYV